MGKRWCGCLLGMLLLCRAMPLAVLAAEEQSPYTYEKQNGGILITKYDWTDAQIVEVPAELDGCPVTGLGDAAFAKCYATQIKLPSTLTDIGEKCFAGCQLIEQINLPDGLLRIGDEAFSQCGSLAELEVPDSVTSVGYQAFFQTPWELSHTEDVFLVGDGILYLYQGDEVTLTLPDTVKAVGEYAFLDHSKLECLVLPDSVTALEEGAFCHCEALSDITFPKTLTRLSATALTDTAWYQAQTDDCMMVSDVLYRYQGGGGAVQVPEGCRMIGESAFENAAVEAVTLPSSLKVLGYGAFYGCERLRRLRIPEGVTSLPEMLCYGCTSLTDVLLPDSLVEIAPRAFSTCTALTHLAVPTGVATVGEQAIGFRFDQAEKAYLLQEDFTLYTDSVAACAYAEKAGMAHAAYQDAPAYVSADAVADPDATNDRARRQRRMAGFVLLSVAGVLLLGGVVLEIRRRKRNPEAETGEPPEDL